MSTRSRMRLQAMAICCIAIAADTSAQTPQSAPVSLAGTSWRLVSFQGAGQPPAIPSDPASYTIEFQADGRLRARIDCNGGRARWTAPAPGQIEFGPLGLTRQKCKPGSLHDRIVTDWRSIRSYALKANQLLLSVRDGNGTYHFAPWPAKQTVTRAVGSEGPFTYHCAASPSGGTLQATFYRTEPAMVLVERDGGTRPAFAVPSASGTRYESKELVFWDRGGETTVVWSGVTLKCQRVEVQRAKPK